jgi:hypothetical protein
LKQRSAFFRDFEKLELIIASRNTIVLETMVSLLMIGGLV